jgi:glycosyltransferase involved in cell wall biosynthesis
MPAPQLSIVVPAFNEEKLLPATLEAIRLAAGASLTRAGIAYELIVCDNNSTDHTGSIARLAGARVVFEPVNQIGRARNSGAAFALGEWILFIDADSVPTAELLGDAAATMARPEVMLAGCTLRMDDAPPVARLFTRGWNTVSRALKLVAGSFILVRTEAFRAVGGFAPGIFAGEELDLAKRLHRLARTRGQKTVILHRHPMATSSRKLTLYKRGELLHFMLRALFLPKRTMTSRDACSPWYDGRR